MARGCHDVAGSGERILKRSFTSAILRGSPMNSHTAGRGLNRASDKWRDAVAARILQWTMRRHEQRSSVIVKFEVKQEGSHVGVLKARGLVHAMSSIHRISISSSPTIAAELARRWDLACGAANVAIWAPVQAGLVAVARCATLAPTLVRRTDTGMSLPNFAAIVSASSTRPSIETDDRD
jgi:hypothetical protein